MERSRELETLVRKAYEAFAKGDHSFFDRNVSSRDGVLVVGTDPSEWWEGKETITSVFKAQFEETGGFDVVADDPHAYSGDDIGWAADHPELILPDGTEIPFRITMVFRKEKEDWKIVQWHASVGVSNEDLFGMALTTD